MADLLSSHREPGNTGKLLLTGLVLALVAAAAFALFYKHENHAPLQASATRVLTLPLHVKLGDEFDDAVYVVPVLHIRNQSSVPLFLKDIAGTVTLQDGRDNPARLVGARDRDRLQQLVPTITPLLKQAGVPPLDPEQQIAPNSTAEGYAIFLYNMPSKEWEQRQSSTARIDFYHQDAVTIPLPR